MTRHWAIATASIVTAMLAATTLAADDGIRVTRDAGEVSRAVDDILTSSDYRRLTRGRDAAPSDKTPDWLKRFFDWLFTSDDSDYESSSSNAATAAIGTIMFYTAIAVLLVVVGVLTYRLLIYANDNGDEDDSFFLDDEEAINPTRPPGDIATNEYERRALKAAQSGDYRTALRELVLGSMSWTERAGLIRYRQGRTNRDYVRAVWRDTPRRDSLLSIVDAFERVFYGHRPANAETFERSLTAFRNSFATEADDAVVAN